ncbi:MAG: LLM class flavin-dependent oxidoreductase, partial [Gemmobacter sp.]
PLHLDDGEVASLMDRFNAACAAHPEVPRPKIMVLRHAYVAENEADAQQAACEITRFYCYFGAWFRNQRPIRQGLIAGLSAAEIAADPVYNAAAMRRNQIIGRPDEVIARLKGYEALGYDEFSLWIDTGMSFARKKASLERLIRDVMPAFA